jgi:hypothetical protein
MIRQRTERAMRWIGLVLMVLALGGCCGAGLWHTSQSRWCSAEPEERPCPWPF